MPAPSFVATGTYLAGASAATAAPAVPPSTAIDQVVLLHLYKENTATVTWPSGFAECTNSPIAVAGGQLHNYHAAWKRLTAADSGTYAISWTGAVWRAAVAISYSGCITSGTPVEVIGFASDATGAATATPAVSGSTLGDDRLLEWSATNWNEGTWTVAAGYTQRTVPTASEIIAGTLAQAVQGSTGSVSGSNSVAASSAAFLIGLIPPPAASSAVRRPVMGASAAASRAGSW